MSPFAFAKDLFPSLSLSAQAGKGKYAAIQKKDSTSKWQWWSYFLLWNPLSRSPAMNSRVPIVGSVSFGRSMGKETGDA